MFALILPAINKKDRAELEQHEDIAKSLGMEFEEYVQKVILPSHLAGEMPLFGIFRREELWQIDKQYGSNWWKD